MTQTFREFYLQSFDVCSGGGRVGLPAEQVEGEEGEVEHVGGGETVVRQAGQITEQGNSLILSEVQGSATSLLAQFCQEDKK